MAGDHNIDILSNGILAVFSKEAVCLTATQNWKEFFELPHQKVSGKALSELVPEKESTKYKSYFNKCLSESRSVRFEIKKLISGDTFLCIMKPWFLNDQEAAGVLAIIDNSEISVHNDQHSQNGIAHQNGTTTSKKLSTLERSLAGKDKFSILVSNMKNIICLHYPDGIFYYLSPSFEDALGYHPEELKGENPYDFFHPDDIKEIQDKSHKPALKGVEQNESEYRFRHKKGHYVWVNSITRPLMEDGKVYALITDTYVIQERKILEQQLRQSEQRFRGAFTYSANGMAIVDVSGKILEVNQRLCEMLGYSKSELRHLTFRDFTHPDDLQENIELFEELKEGKRENYQVEKRYIKKNGDLVWAILAVSMTQDEKGDPEHLVSQVTDITDRKRAEKELQQLLEITSDQNERLMNFAHIVSHNLRSHSSNIKMLLELLQEESDPEERQLLLEMLDHASKNLNETIDNLNETAKGKSRQKVKLTELPLRNFIEKASSNLEAFILKNYAIIKNSVAPHIKVLASPAYLDSILLNLLTNAIKYSSPDKNPIIEFDAEVHEEEVILKVSDNGMGIDLSKHQDELFNLHNTFHGNEDANGIGLFITRNQIEAMGGSIEVKSKVREGTTFYIMLKLG